MATITATVTQEVTRTITKSSSTPSSTLRAAPQGGVFEGLNPTHYDIKNPIILFIIQAIIVIAFTRILHWPLSKLRQPRVIAEVITGIILGPSVMGRIPGFTKHIFPPASIPAFNLVANLGLVLFLFLVGLEVDLRFLVTNWRIALSVGAAGMALPFGLGVAIAWGLYHEFHNDGNTVPISFGIYALFIGVAMAITAFPVLCRILVSLKLLQTPVGVIVLSAGVANDVVGWILLALCVALVNSGAGLTALYIFIVAVGYTFTLAYAVRPVFIWILRRSGSLENGPSQGIVALTLLMVLTSAFFTQVIGIHAIFGAFMVGLICPHEGGFAIKLTEKLEDLVSTLFLPLYFALSGLSTNLGLLDNGITWAYVVGVTAIAFIAKITGGTLASRLNGLFWRESFTVGCLMSCKGLVELIVLNIGLQARILSTRTFTIFVVMALVTTFATTPLVVWLYPQWYQHKLDLYKKGKITWDGNPIMREDGRGGSAVEHEPEVANRVLVYLRTDGLSSLFAVLSLFTGKQKHSSIDQASVKVHQQSVVGEKAHVTAETTAVSSENSSIAQPRRPLRVHGLRLWELTERNSSVMKVSEIEEYASRDPIIKAFGTCAWTTARPVSISGQIAVVPDHSFADALVTRAADTKCDFTLLPWSETGSISENPSPFDSVTSGDPLANRQFSNLIADVFERAITVCGVGVFIDPSLIKRHVSPSTATSSPVVERPTQQLTRRVTGLSLPDVHEHAMIQFRSQDIDGRHQIRVFYAGTQDDLYAVKLAVQFAESEAIEVRVVKLQKDSEAIAIKSSKQASHLSSDVDFEFATLRSGLPERIAHRIRFEEIKAASIGDTTVVNALLDNTVFSSPGLEKAKSDMTVVIGRSGVSTRSATRATSSSRDLSSSIVVSEPSRTLGDNASSLLARLQETGSSSSHRADVGLLVVQAKDQSWSAGDRTGGASELRRKLSHDSQDDA